MSVFRNVKGAWGEISAFEQQKGLPRNPDVTNRTKSNVRLIEFNRTQSVIEHNRTLTKKLEQSNAD